MGMNALPHADATNRPAADGSDATLQVNFADMINQAMQAPETDTDAVQKAREAAPVRPTHEPREHPVRRREYPDIRHLKD